MSLANTPHVTHVETRYVLGPDNSWARVVFVKTDLHLDCNHPKHDVDAVTAMLGTVAAAFKAASDHYDRLEVSGL